MQRAFVSVAFICGLVACGDDVRHAPGADAVGTEAGFETEFETETEVESEVEFEFETEVEIEIETGIETEFEFEIETEVETEIETESETESEVESETASDAPDATDTACAPPGAPWTRRVTPTGGAVVFSELMLGASSDRRIPSAPATAWLELFNPMSIEIDVSGWRLAGDFQFTFPDGSFIGAGARAVVAVDPAALAVSGVSPQGPMTGAWPVSALLELRNNMDRLMDLVAFDAGPWPPLAPASAITKRDPLALSARAESWTPSPTAGGTPGRADASDGPRAPVAADASWRFLSTGARPSDWALPTFDDSAWPSARAPIVAGGGAAAPATFQARVTADNHFAVYLGAADGTNLRLVGRDTSGDWTSPETFALAAEPGDHLYLAAWEGPGDSGSPQMLIADLTGPDGATTGTSVDSFEVVLGPAQSNPGDALTAAAPSAASLAVVIAAADNASAFVPPHVSRARTDAPWGGAVGGMFSAGDFLWSDTFDPNSETNRDETYALFRTHAPLVADNAGIEAAPTTALFRYEFEVAGDPAALTFALTLTADDGAAVYLNGQEVARRNMPNGTLDAATLALSPVAPADLVSRLALPSDALAEGPNVLAIEVHQATEVTPDLRFAAELVATPTLPDDPEPAGDVVIDELMFHGSGPEVPDWIELTNRGPSPVDLGGWQLVDAVACTFPDGAPLAPGAFLVVAQDAAEFARAYPGVPIAGAFGGSLSNDGEQLVLRDACGTLVDRVRYADGGRWPDRADDGGSSLELRDPRADNNVPEAWAASDETDRVGWETITYRGVLAPSAVGPDGQWQEFVLGLLDSGEVLIDDLHVVEDPDGAAIELIANPTFEGTGSGSVSHWRFLGTHATSHLATDPDDPGNPVLALVATGPTEHMHNQVVTTLANGRALANGRTYAISLRARWVGGSDLLSTRLYFNRLARTTNLTRTPAGGTPGTAAPTNIGPTFRHFAHTPLVPRALAPVVVSVHADDPDGVTAARVWYAVDGGPFTSVAMTPAAPLAPGDSPVASDFTATLPGQAQGAIVQFYVEADDAVGAHATFPARGPASRALYRVDGSDLRAAAGALHTVRILMTPGDNATFHAPTNVMSNASTGVTVLYDERQAFYDIGVRAKGSERARNQQARLGFSVRFDPSAPLRGVLDTVSLDRSEGVWTGVREILMDIVASRAGSVSAEYNDLVYMVTPRPEHTGPAILQTTRFSDLMLDSQFPGGGDGNVYEYELVYYPVTTHDGTPTGLKLPEPDGVVGTPLRDLGPDPESYRFNYLLKTHRADDDFSGIMALAQTFSLPEAEFRAALPEVLDVDQWLRAFAFMAVSGAVDHYGAGAQHNAQIYVRPSDGRGLLFSHDLDFYSGDPRSAVIGNGDLQRLIAVPGLKRVFYGHLYDILTTSYRAATMARWRDTLSALIPTQNFASHHQFIVDRSAWLMSGASDAVTRAFPTLAFAVTTHGGAAFSAPPGEIILAGTGWIDVRAIRVVDGATNLRPPVRWPDDTHWELTLTLAPGAHDLALEALDSHDAIVGTDTMSIEVSP